MHSLFFLFCRSSNSLSSIQSNIRVCDLWLHTFPSAGTLFSVRGAEETRRTFQLFLESGRLCTGMMFSRSQMCITEREGVVYHSALKLPWRERTSLVQLLLPTQRSHRIIERPRFLGCTTKWEWLEHIKEMSCQPWKKTIRGTRKYLVLLWFCPEISLWAVECYCGQGARLLPARHTGPMCHKDVSPEAEIIPPFV